MNKLKVLVTCPPMLGQIDKFRALFEAKDIELVTPDFVQIMSEDELGFINGANIKIDRGISNVLKDLD